VSYRSEHIAITLDHERRLVRFTRSAAPFTSAEDARTEFVKAMSLIGDAERPRLRLLADMRAAPGRNDAAFERAVGSLSERLFGGYARAAFLVRTAVGSLQIQRVAREHHASAPRVFTDEAEALRYLDETT
jgi:hypothetical protein